MLHNLREKDIHFVDYRKKSRDDSEMVERIAKMNKDDVAQAQQTEDDHSEVSSAMGINSCFYTKSIESQGKRPILKAVLNKTKKSSIDTLDNLILTLDKDLPNEFGDFPRITQMTFPDLFPIPVNEQTFMGTSMMNKDVRRHLLDYYDGRFCDTKFIFWMFNILTRHFKTKKKSPIDTLDNLILTLDKDLPNEFGDFPRITQMTFPDLFPIPVNEYTFKGSSMMNKNVGRHLLDFYW